ncbi:SIMPL domain-containing protein [Arthrobacter sp. UYCu712]|uniref:SIMPL domain-containing protein n=1 Tax=Arthrobacter sp. UYCu712 TaxID=3156340 RepID=UPI0033961A57
MHDVTDTSRSISVTGSGSAEATPDLLTLSIGVECRRDNVGAAYRDAGRVSSAITGVLRDHRVDGRDISTSGLNVRAEVNWQEGRGQAISGYLASSMLSVRIRELAASSDIIAAAVAAGGNDVRLNGLELGFADPAAVTARAREAAWADALATASHFAALAGTRLGRVLSLTQQSGAPAPIPVAKMQRAVAAESLNVEAGESSVNATVGVVWELLD